MSLGKNVSEAVAGISHRLDFITRTLESTAHREQNAKDHGFALACTVQAYLNDPEGVGKNALAAAYESFMAAHAGGFPSKRESVPALGELLTSHPGR